MSTIASGFHQDPPSGKFSTTHGATSMYLETRVDADVTEDGTTLFTTHDAIRIPTNQLTLLADMLIRHDREITDRPEATA